jgi:hypothetical protein
MPVASIVVGRLRRPPTSQRHVAIFHSIYFKPICVLLQAVRHSRADVIVLAGAVKLQGSRRRHDAATDMLGCYKGHREELQILPS